MIKNTITFIGVVFLIVGILGFFMNPILGIFETDAIHNIIHLATGIAAILTGLTSEAAARGSAKLFGVIYAVVAVLGLISPAGDILGIIANNSADTLFHFVFAAIFLVLGFAPEKMPGRTAMSH